MTAPFIVLGVGAGVLAVSIIGGVISATSPCGPGDSSIFGCNFGTTVAFGAVGFLGGVVFLVGVVWTIVDAVLNAQRVDVEPARPSQDAAPSSKRQASGLVLARF